MTTWMSEQIAILETHWPFESASQIATRIMTETGKQFTRNAVVGKAHRKRLQKAAKGPVMTKPKRIHKPRQRPRKPAMADAPPYIVGRPSAPVAPISIARPDPDTTINIFDLGDKMCRYPYGDENFTFCGLQAGDNPYCEAHMSLCYNGAWRR